MRRLLRRALWLLLATVGLILGGIAADAHFSGWRRLASSYRTGAPGQDVQLAIQAGGLGAPRWYHRVAPLHAAVSFGGLRLSYPQPYSLWHPPLELPWRALRVVEFASGSEGSTVLLSVGNPEEARVSLHGELATIVKEWLSPTR